MINEEKLTKANILTVGWERIVSLCMCEIERWTVQGNGLKGWGIKRGHSDRGLDLHHGQDGGGGVQHGRRKVGGVCKAHRKHAAAGGSRSWQENLNILSCLWIQQHLPLSLWRCVHIEELQRCDVSHVAEGRIAEGRRRRRSRAGDLVIVRCLLPLCGCAGAAVPLVNRSSSPTCRTLVLLFGNVPSQFALVLLRCCHEVEEGSSWEGWDVAQRALNVTTLGQLRRQVGGESG